MAIINRLKLCRGQVAIRKSKSLHSWLCATHHYNGNGNFIYIAYFIIRKLNVLNTEDKNIKTCVDLQCLKAVKTAK